jgi:hypothetical protein
MPGRKKYSWRRNAGKRALPAARIGTLPVRTVSFAALTPVTRARVSASQTVLAERRESFAALMNLFAKADSLAQEIFASLAGTRAPLVVTKIRLAQVSWFVTRTNVSNAGYRAILVVEMNKLVLAKQTATKLGQNAVTMSVFDAEARGK